MRWLVSIYSFTVVLAVVVACETRTVDATAKNPTPPEPAPPDPMPPVITPVAPVAARTSYVQAYTFTIANYFSYGAAIQRYERKQKGRTCSGASLWLANGNDHIPQPLTRFDVPNFSVAAGQSCKIGAAARMWSPWAKHFSDVVAADVIAGGVVGDELFVSALSESDGCAESGGVWWMRDRDDLFRTWEKIDVGYAAAALALGDVDRSGKLDLVVGTMGIPDEFPMERLTCRSGSGLPLDAALADATPQQFEPTRADAGDRLPDWNGLFGISPKLTDLGGDEPLMNDRSGCMEMEELLANARGSAVLVYPDMQKGRPLALPANGAVDVELHDVDLDGMLDIVAAGLDVRVFYGPISRGVSPRCAVLPWSRDDDNLAALGVDVTHVDDIRGEPHTWIAASQGCLQLDHCTGSLKNTGVTVWRRPAAPAGPEEWRSLGLATNGMPAAVRFVHSDDDEIPDLLVGRMHEFASASDQVCSELGDRPGHKMLGMLGAPLLAFHGERDGGAGPWLQPTPETIHLQVRPPNSNAQKPEKQAFPMAFRILPYADDHGAEMPCEGKKPDEGFKAQYCDFKGPLAVGSVLSYRGPGFIASVGAIRDSGNRPVGFHHVDGEPYVTLKTRPKGGLTVFWRTSRRPSYAITTTSPLPGPTGSSLFIESFDPKPWTEEKQGP